ncbi:MAG: DUF3124 domain-containing protein [Magnetococcales bacterium]|nr:DUF3124 domain-containing protein [Magnetococcales bacterium]NGZ28158.1 DUF3124 domain-containing protein [Magnetococcales bacterium]
MKARQTLAAVLTFGWWMGSVYAWSGDLPPLSSGQTVYVPVYSQIYHGNMDRDGKPKEILLSSMLSVRNTDPKHSMTITSVKYYDTHGKVLREYLSQPVTLAAMGSTDYFVEYKDRSGGTGANFVVVWKSAKPVNPPIMEAVHAYFWGSSSQSFISRGQAIHTHE